MPPALLQAFNFDINSLRSFEGWMALPLLPSIVTLTLFGAGVAIGASLFEHKDIAA